MSYPTLEQYNYAMQHPNLALADPALKKGTIVKTGLGLPLALCGGFALTYTITSDRKKYAVRCFHKQSNKLETRYKAISNRLKALQSPYFLDFEFQPMGVTVDGGKYPVVKMAWASGKTLGEFMAANYRKKSQLGELNKSLLSLAEYLEKERIAHGDIQPGNLMVADEGKSVQLIDYDGMYVDELKSLGGSELGLRNFQHPGRNGAAWDMRIDRFSFILLNLAIRAMEAHPELWDKTQSDENSFLFTAQDFIDPGGSAIFQVLDADPKFREDIRNFAAICKAPFDKIPTPEEFLAKRNIPQIAITISSTGKISRVAYSGAYLVLDAEDYELCLENVGERVELIGRIVEVKYGMTKHDKPYVFINFGNWKGEIVKLSIWSEGLEALNKQPDESWVGKWVSVVGLMEPPYHSYRHRYTHLSISITQSNQIHFITEKEAQFRLSGAAMSGPQAAPSPENKAILERMRRSSSSDSLSLPVSRPSTPSAINPTSTKTKVSKPLTSTPTGTVPVSATRNQTIVKNMRSSQPAPATAQASPGTTQQAKSQSVKAQSSKAYTVSSQQTKSKSALSPKKNFLSRFAPLGAAFVGTFLIGILVLGLLFLSYPGLSKTLSPSPTALRNTAVPTTIASESSQDKIVPTATDKPDCITWRDIRRSFEGDVICVYGIVASERYFPGENGSSYQLIRFSDNINSFYFISYEKPLRVTIGECVSARAAISYDPNGVPFMEISRIEKNKYSCK